METVHLQCGHCQKLMAIGVAHLGGQVQCPHCRSVVQTPAPTAPAPLAVAESAEKDSIFGGPDSSEDVLSGTSPPKPHRPHDDETVVTQPQPAPVDPAPPETAPLPDAPVDLTSFQRPPIYQKSVAPALALIFLVPYAITTTAYIIYLLFFAAPSRPHPLDMLPDPVPSKQKGAPRPARDQTSHNFPLAPHQKTALGKPIQIGALQMTPEHLRLTPEGNLQLSLRARNVSTDTAFEPIHDFFVNYKPSREADSTDGKPYSFVEAPTKNVGNIYGGYLEYRKKLQGKETTMPSGVINPNEEEIVVITTMDNYHLHVRSIVQSKEPYVWRVHVRRGLVRHNGKDVSATAVFGVEFTPQQIERDGADSGR